MLDRRPQTPRVSGNIDDPSGAGFTAGYGEGVIVNGGDQQADRRAHMRALTTARQAAERRALHGPEGSATSGSARRGVERQARRVELQAELQRIEAEHQTWLQLHSPDA
ncbi:MAG: hypothetical protein NVSMB65_19250 [Chloroflexota bacterium]